MSQPDTGGVIDEFIKRDEKNSRLIFDTKPEDGLYIEDHIIEKKQFLRLPGTFNQLFQKLKFKSFMGLFPEINRAWVTFDNRFYIWSFLDGSDFNEYDDLDQVITAVALTVPKKKIFKDYVKYVLVIATSIQVVLVAVTYRDDELNLLPTNYCCATENTLILNIKCTKDGRIFLSGKNGDLYELIYSLESGFFSSKIMMKNLTRSFFSYIKPTFMMSNPDPMTNLAVDKSNHVLYSLSERSTIRVFDLGTKGETFRSVASNKVESTIGEARPQMSRNIVKILEIEQSDKVHLAVINKDGDRIFFDCSHSHGSRPRYLDFKDTGSCQVDGRKILQNVSSCFYQKGVWIFGCSDDMSDELYFVMTENRIDLNQERSSQSFETLSRVRVDGRVLCISEIPGPVKILEKGSELQLQHRSPNREFVCLTSKGIHIVRKKQPVEILEEILDTPHFPQQSVNRFFQKYGNDESCAMCLIVICQGVYTGGGRTEIGGKDQIPFSLRSLHQMKRVKNPRVIRNADVAFFHHGGSARFETIQRQRTNAGRFHSAGKQRHNVHHSSVHNGIILYLSRILKPIWDRKVMNYEEKEKKIKIHGVQPKIELIEEIIQMLCGLRFFMEKKPQIYRVPEQRVMGDDRDGDNINNNNNQDQKNYTREEAQRLEKRNLNHMYRLIVRCIESLAFVKMLSDVDLSDLFNVEVEFRWDSNQFKSLVDNLAKLSFKEFVNQSSSTSLMKDIVKLIIHQRQCNLEQLFLTLARNCPSLFTSRDICDFHAFHLVQQASEHTGTRNGRLILKEALNAYLKIAGSLDSIPTVCHSFIRLRFFEGAVVLALRGAERIDPTQLAEEYQRRSGMFENSAGSELYEKRVDCYKVAIRVLEILEEIPFDPRSNDVRAQKSFVLELMKNSKDVLFHEYLYEDLISKMEKARSGGDPKREEYFRKFLLETFKSSRFLENFLVRRRRFYLLGSYYYHCGKFLEAADILDKLASDPSTKGVTLDMRIGYLEKALRNAEEANKRVNRSVLQVRDVSEMVETLKNKIEVAVLQRSIMNHLEGRIQRPLREGRALLAAQNLVAMRRREGESPQQFLEKLEKIINRLNYELVSISTLYNDCAIPYELFDSCLKILHLSNYEDKFLIRDLWKKIILPQRTKEQVSEKFSELAGEIENKKSKIFPLDYIVAILELKTFDSNDPYFVVRLMRENRIPFTDLYMAYRKIFDHLFHYKISDPLVSDDAYLIDLFKDNRREGQVHIFKIVCHLLLELKNQIVDDEVAGGVLSMDEMFPNYVLTKHLEQYYNLLGQMKGFPAEMMRDIKDALLKMKKR